jgi:hypothetical protein
MRTCSASSRFSKSTFSFVNCKHNNILQIWHSGKHPLLWRKLYLLKSLLQRICEELLLLRHLKGVAHILRTRNKVHIPIEAPSSNLARENRFLFLELVEALHKLVGDVLFLLLNLLLL